MSRKRASVFIVDDHPMTRHSLSRLLRQGGYRTSVFSGGREFLDYVEPTMTACLILDYQMPNMNGLEVQSHLNARSNSLPIIFVTASNDVNVAVQAMQHGAVDYLTKPVEQTVLLDRVERAINHHIEVVANREMLQQRLQRLTPREREVMQLVFDGESTKRIAALIGTSVQTAVKHRSRVLEKMGVDNDVRLVHLVQSAQAS